MVLFLHMTSRVDGDPYPTLLQEKGFGGFPSLAFMDADGDVLASPEGRSVDAFNETLGAVEAYLDLKSKFEGGDKTVAKALLLAEMKFGKIEYAEAKAKYDELTDLTADDKKQLEADLLNLEVLGLLEKAQSGQISRDDLAKAYGEMALAGRHPTAQNAIGSFWQFALDHAYEIKDAKLYEQGLTVLQKEFGHIERNARIFEQMELRLKELKDGN